MQAKAVMLDKFTFKYNRKLSDIGGVNQIAVNRGKAGGFKFVFRWFQICFLYGPIGFPRNPFPPGVSLKG